MKRFRRTVGIRPQTGDLCALTCIQNGRRCNQMQHESGRGWTRRVHGRGLSSEVDSHRTLHSEPRIADDRTERVLAERARLCKHAIRRDADGGVWEGNTGGGVERYQDRCCGTGSTSGPAGPASRRPVLLRAVLGSCARSRARPQRAHVPHGMEYELGHARRRHGEPRREPAVHDELARHELHAALHEHERQLHVRERLHRATGPQPRRAGPRHHGAVLGGRRHARTGQPQPALLQQHHLGQRAHDQRP